ncbi:MAG: NnrS family protein [Caldilineaceae bacterium]|nr:NnrS family protein [Caldilineaceae bacterium]
MDKFVALMASLSVADTINRAPFGPFFLLATVDALVGGAAWLPITGLTPDYGQMANSAADWHRSVLLFGMVPAILCGFLLTALPRWTGKPRASRKSVYSLLGLWLSSRVASVVISPAVGIGLAAAFLMYLLILAGGTVLAARDVRSLKIVLLLGAFCCSAAFTASSYHVDLALRMALAAIVGLMMIIGGRLVPALTLAYAEARAGTFNTCRLGPIERGAALAATVALVAWVAAPQQTATGAACAAAALAQLFRAAQWRSWKSGASAVMALHIGYGWIVAGFVLLAVHVYAPAVLPQSVGIHAWMIGAMGTMGIAVMSSMVRRHSGRAYARSNLATSAFAFMTLSCVARLLAGLLPGDPTFWIASSGSLWVAAFGAFLMAYWRQMLQWPGHTMRNSRANTR